MSELNQNEWVIIFYPRTGALRLHPSVEAAKQHMSVTGFATNCYKSPKDFQVRHDHYALVGFWEKVKKNAAWRWPSSALGPKDEVLESSPPDIDTERFSVELWNFMQKAGDRVTGLSVAQTRSKDHYQLNIEKMKSLMADEEAFKKAYPKQCRVIIERLSKYDSPYQLEKELERMMNSIVAMGLLKTKQDPWLIFQYYRASLIDSGLLVRGNEGVEEDREAAE